MTKNGHSEMLSQFPNSGPRPSQFPNQIEAAVLYKCLVTQETLLSRAT